MMGLTAEMLGRMHGIEREEQDTIRGAVASEGVRSDEEGPLQERDRRIEGHDETARASLCDIDEVIRPTRPWRRSRSSAPRSIRKGGTVTAGNSSAISDGASAHARHELRARRRRSA